MIETREEIIGQTQYGSVNIVSNTTFIYKQDSSSDAWEINHNLARFPSVTVVDSGGNVVFGNVTYIDENNLVVVFSAPFTGKAYLN